MSNNTYIFYTLEIYAVVENIWEYFLDLNSRNYPKKPYRYALLSSSLYLSLSLSLYLSIYLSIYLSLNHSLSLKDRD